MNTNWELLDGTGGQYQCRKDGPLAMTTPSSLTWCMNQLTMHSWERASRHAGAAHHVSSPRPSFVCSALPALVLTSSAGMRISKSPVHAFPLCLASQGLVAEASHSKISSG